MFASKRKGEGGAGALAFALAVLLCAGCDEQRQRECQELVGAMQPLDAPEGATKVASAIPTLDAVRGVKSGVEHMTFHDQPLAIYAQNYEKTLSVLANTLEVKSSSMPPDGVDEVIKKNLKEARADADDVRRYCAQ